MAKQSNYHNKKQQKLTREQRDNQVLGQVFRLFLLGIVAECFLFFFSNLYLNGTGQTLVTIYHSLPYACAVGLVAVVVGIVLLLKKREVRPLVRKVYGWITGVGAFVAICSLVLYLVYPNGGTYLCVLVPILTVLGMVYLLFQREFFLIAVILSGALFTVWVCRKGVGTVNWNGKALVGAGLVLVGLVVLTALTAKIQKQDGRWMAGVKVRLLPADCDYRMLYIAYALSFVAILLAMVVVSTTYYSMWVLGVALFAFAVYYTTKLM